MAVTLAALLLACAPEYSLQALLEPPPETWATVAPCPGYAALWLPLEGDPLGVWWSDGDGWEPQPYDVDRWLTTTCPAAGDLRVLWTAILSQDTGGA